MARRIGAKILTFGPECDGQPTCRCRHLCTKRECLARTSHNEILVAHGYAKRGEKGDAQRMREYSDANLRAPDDKPFCTECLTVFWACSRNKLYPPPAKCAPKERHSQKDISVMSWFLAQLFCLDVDPEDGKRTMPAAKKCQVYEWYKEDVAKWPQCYAFATKRWFEKVWDNNFPNVVCRKWSRFAKCSDCVNLRATIATHGRRRRRYDKRQRPSWRSTTEL